MKSPLLFLIMGTFIGAGLLKTYQSLWPAVLPVPAPVTIESCPIEDKLVEEINKINVDEYYALKDQQQQIEKASEIYGQMINLFLVFIGERLNGKNHWARFQLDSAKVLTACRPVPAVRDNDRSSEEEFTPRNTALSDNETKSVETREARLRSALPLSREGRLLRPERYYKQSAPITKKSSLFEKLQGSYNGNINLVKKGEVWNVEMTVEYQFNGKKYEGNANIQISSHAKGVFSNSRSSGDNSNFQFNPNDPGIIVIELDPDSFARLEVVEKAGRVSSLVGTFYQLKREKKKYVYAGTVFLTKL